MQLKTINENKMKTGKRIKTLRIEAGFESLDSFAEKLFYSRQTVAKWERGESMPSLNTLYDIAGLLDCDIGYLLCLYDTRYYEHADICEATGLSEAAANLLQNEVIALKRRNLYEQKHNAPPTKTTITTSFINFLLENGQALFQTIIDSLQHENEMQEIKKEPYFPLVEKAFLKMQEQLIQGRLPWSDESKEELFYRLLEMELSSHYTDELTPETISRMLDEKIILLDDEEIAEINNRLRSNIPEKMIADFRFSDLYGLLELEEKKRYFKYELSDIFMDIVKAYVKEGVENGGKN